MENYMSVCMLTVYTDGAPTKTVIIENMQIYSLNNALIQAKRLGEKSANLTTSARHASESLLALFRNLRRLAYPRFLEKALSALNFENEVSVKECLFEVDEQQTLNLEINLYRCKLEGGKAFGLSKIMYRLLSGNPKDFDTKPITEWVTVNTVESASALPKSTQPVYSQPSVHVAQPTVILNASTGFQLGANFSVLADYARDYTRDGFAPTVYDAVRLYNLVENIGKLLVELEVENKSALVAYRVVNEIRNLILKNTTIDKAQFLMLGRVINSFNIRQLVEELGSSSSTAKA